MIRLDCRLGSVEVRFDLPALPNAVWFFYASQKIIYRLQMTSPHKAFLAQTFRSPKFHPLLILAGLALPFSRRDDKKIIEQGD